MNRRWRYEHDPSYRRAVDAYGGDPREWIERQ
jgi:hypothetical protein